MSAFYGVYTGDNLSRSSTVELPPADVREAMSLDKEGGEGFLPPGCTVVGSNTGVVTTSSPRSSHTTASVTFMHTHSPMSVGGQGTDVGEGPSGFPSLSQQIPAEGKPVDTGGGTQCCQHLTTTLAATWQMCRSVMSAQNRTSLALV